MATTNPRLKVHYLNPNGGFKSSKERADFLATTDNKDLDFTVLYWEIASVASTTRDMLALSGVKWRNAPCPSDEEWDGGKIQTAFSVLPMLTIKGPAGQELNLSESMVIDMFLAERFGLMGDNDWEKLAISSFYSNIHFLRERTFTEVQDVPKESKKHARDLFFKYTLQKFIEDHEYHLAHNGNNGHYVGNKMSLADLHLANVIHYYSTLPWGKMALEKFSASEAIWKVKEKVDNHPGLAAWRSSDEFKKYEKGSFKWYLRCTVPGEEVVDASKSKSDAVTKELSVAEA